MRYKDRADIPIKLVSYLFITLFSIACIIPFMMMVSTSFTTESAVVRYGFNLWPREFSMAAYNVVFSNPEFIMNSYMVTIMITVTGTISGLFLIAMTGYALSRPDFAWRNYIAFFIYFTTLFSGGLVPYFLLVSRYLGLRDNYLAVILPLLMSPWLLILMRNFAKNIPFSLTESAKIDGAGDVKIFVQIILPMLKPALATIGLFLALGYWNEWFNALLFISGNRPQPLQLFLHQVVTQAQFIRNSPAAAFIDLSELPQETIRMAVGVVTTGPIILLYPFVQRYFIKGITIGAVKG
ncbi:MAG: carbohydrate ABC transporter permease [Defluviitaleaceae bacterium]|nr:carbohydrate ABC transporter permease [Defluviitaleaceae bacterium]